MPTSDEVPTSDETALPKEDDGESWLELLRDGSELQLFVEENIGWRMERERVVKKESHVEIDDEMNEI